MARPASTEGGKSKKVTRDRSSTCRRSPSMRRRPPMRAVVAGSGPGATESASSSMRACSRGISSSAASIPESHPGGPCTARSVSVPVSERASSPHTGMSAVPSGVWSRASPTDSRGAKSGSRARMSPASSWRVARWVNEASARSCVGATQRWSSIRRKRASSFRAAETARVGDLARVRPSAAIGSAISADVAVRSSPKISNAASAMVRRGTVDPPLGSGAGTAWSVGRG